MTAESTPLRSCKVLVNPLRQKQSAWRKNPNIVRFEAFLLSRGLLPSSADTMCQRLYTVAKRAGGLRALSRMDETFAIPRFFPKSCRKYQLTLEAAVRTYAEFERVRKDSSTSSSWKDEPRLVAFYQYLIQTERSDTSQMIELCQRIHYLSYKRGIASLEELTYCDADKLVDSHFGDMSFSYCSQIRRAIRTYQEFIKQGVRL